MENCLGRLELTHQPEETFYKDEGGPRFYYLFAFFVLRGERSPELKNALDKVSDGRHKIAVDCELLYDGSLEPVEDQSILQLLGNSKSEKTDVTEMVPEFDPTTFQGSVRYRINKVSMRKDNHGFRLKIKLRGLEDVIEPAITEPTQVLSKRRRLRKEHRVPEQTKRLEVEAKARRRNREAEERLARMPPTSRPIIHELTKEAGFTEVPSYPDLKISPDSENRGGGGEKGQTSGKTEIDIGKHSPGELHSSVSQGSGDSGKLPDPTYMMALIEQLQQRVQLLEQRLGGVEYTMCNSNMSYIPGQDAGAAGESGSTSAPPLPHSAPGQSSETSLKDFPSLPSLGPLHSMSLLHSLSMNNSGSKLIHKRGKDSANDGEGLYSRTRSSLRNSKRHKHE